MTPEPESKQSPEHRWEWFGEDTTTTEERDDECTPIPDPDSGYLPG